MEQDVCPSKPKKKKNETPLAKREHKRMGSIAGRINRSWIWRLFWIFIIVDIVVFSLVGYSIGGEDIFWDMARLRVELEFLYQPVLALEAVYMVFYMIFGKRGIRRKLRPLYRMATAAQQLSETAKFDEAKFHDLETAISQISPSRPDAKLSTGDSDLQGLEVAVNNLMERMRESYRQQSRFVSDASHELRTPIAVIQGYANMLDRWGTEDEKVLQESIAAIKAESEQMKKLVEQLLFLARGDSGKTQLQLERFSLSDLLQEVYDESVMIDDTHTYSLVPPETEVFVMADPSMIKQTARILVDNASKYSPEGETITLKAGFGDQKMAFFSVQDTGVGMGPDDTAHVFERFYRSDSSRTRGTGGTGLGLSIAKWIIDKHEGYFDVLSREGLGTRITVYIPAGAAGN